MHNLISVIFLTLGLFLFVYGWVMNIKLDLLGKADKYDYISIAGVVILIITTLVISINFFLPYINLL